MSIRKFISGRPILVRAYMVFAAIVLFPIVAAAGVLFSLAEGGKEAWTDFRYEKLASLRVVAAEVFHGIRHGELLKRKVNSPWKR